MSYAQKWGQQERERERIAKYRVASTNKSWHHIRNFLPQNSDYSGKN
jgi:hypothetical protein